MEPSKEGIIAYITEWHEADTATRGSFKRWIKLKYTYEQTQLKAFKEVIEYFTSIGM